MTDNQVMHIGVEAMTLGMKVAGPILLVSLVIGFLISLLQSVTQVQEQTLTFVPKVIAVAFVLLLLGNWMMGEMISFTRQLIQDIPTMLKQ